MNKLVNQSQQILAQFANSAVTQQALSQYIANWQKKAASGTPPTVEDIDALLYLLSYQLAYLIQAGVPEFEPGAIYYTNSIVNYNGVLYQSMSDGNTGNVPSGSSAMWSGSVGNFANVNLSNLQYPTAINKDLLFANDGQNNIGSTAIYRPYGVYASAQVNAGSDVYNSVPAITIGTQFRGLGDDSWGVLFETTGGPDFQLGWCNSPLQIDLLQLFNTYSGIGSFLKLRGGYVNNTVELRLTAPIGQSLIGPNLVWDVDGSGNFGLGNGYATSSPLQDLTYVGLSEGPNMNGWTIEYVNDVVAGQEYVTESGTTTTVHIQSGVTTALTIFRLFGYSNDDVYGQNSYIGVNFSVVANVTGTASNPQTAPASTTLAGGSANAFLRPNYVYSKLGMQIGDAANGSGSLSIWAATATTAGSGTHAIPGSAAAFLPVTINGSPYKLALYNV
jgi:hypothetical protein